MRRLKRSAILLLGLGLLTAAGDRLSADETDCAVFVAGTATEVATGSVLTFGQAVIGQAFSAAGGMHAGALFCLRSHGLGSVPGDCDNDGDVDLGDYDAFESCISGPGGGLGAGCECSDSDADGDVDLLDFGDFQVAFTG